MAGTNIFTLLDKELHLTEDKKADIMHYCVCPRENTPKDLLEIICSLQNEWLKNHISKLIEVNQKYYYLQLKPREFIDMYNAPFEGQKEGNKIPPEASNQIFRPDEYVFGIFKRNKIITMEGVLYPTQKPDTWRGCGSIHWDVIKKIVQLFCEQYTVDIPEHRNQTFKEAQKKSGLAKKQSTQSKNSGTA